MILVPFSAILRKDSIASEAISKQPNRKPKDVGNLQDPLLERDIRVLCLRYLKGQFVLDFIANVPIFIYELLYGWPLA